MGLKKRWVVVVVIVLVVVGAMQAAHIRPSVVMGQAGGDESDAPYLYYFSGRAHAWVIERADGTDRRLFGYGVIPPELNAADQVQWSPSGRWLSWLGYNNCKLPGSYVGCITDRQWQVLGTGTQSPLSSLNNRPILSLKWSPTDDILLVQEVLEFNTPDQKCHSEGSCPISHVRYSLIDAASDRELWVFDRSFSTQVEYVKDIWLADGQTVVFDYGVGDWDTQRHSVITIERDGQRTERTIYADGLSIYVNGMASYKRGTDLWLTDLKTGEVSVIPLGPLENMPFSIMWYPSGGAALLNATLKDSSQLWWLNIKTGQLSLIADSVKSFSISPSFRYAYYIANDDSVYYFDTTHLQVIFLTWMREGIGLEWKVNHQLLIWQLDYEDYMNDGLLVDLETGIGATISVASPVGPFTELGRLSSDGHYIAWMEGGPVIYDRETGQKLMLREDARGWMSNPGHGVEWHPQRSWFLIFDNGAIGDSGPIYPGVASADGTVRRDIYSYYVNWLPDGINPEIFPLDSTPPLPKPVMTLKGTDFSIILDWSPDGKYLAADNNGWWITDIPQTMNLWDVTNGRLIAQIGDYYSDYLFHTNNREFDWEYLPSGVYVPIELREMFFISLPGWKPPKIRAISPDGNFWLVQSRGGKFYIFNRELSRIEITLPDDYYLISGKFSPDSRLFASNSYFLNALRIWDTETWNILFEAEIAASALAFSPDGEYLAVGVSWDVEIWRVSDLIGKTVPTPNPSPTH